MARQKGSREAYGEITITHRGRKIKTSVGSRKYESTFGGTSGNRMAHTTGRVPEGYNHRPELIASLFYGTAASWWLVCETNNIFDVFEQLKGGSSLRLPR
tara:strand:- start:801 stop:1100 length:300 start_codon:yes stop_codon:yes gene_type:complete